MGYGLWKNSYFDWNIGKRYMDVLGTLSCEIFICQWKTNSKSGIGFLFADIWMLTGLVLKHTLAIPEHFIWFRSHERHSRTKITTSRNRWSLLSYCKLRSKLNTSVSDMITILKRNLKDSIAKLVYPMNIYTVDQLRHESYQIEQIFSKKDRMPFVNRYVPNSRAAQLN